MSQLTLNDLDINISNDEKDISNVLAFKGSKEHHIRKETSRDNHSGEKRDHVDELRISYSLILAKFKKECLKDNVWTIQYSSAF